MGGKQRTNGKRGSNRGNGGGRFPASGRVTLRDWRLPLLTAAAFLFARLSGGGLPWFLFWALAGLFLASWYWTRQLAKGVACRWDLPSRVLTVGQQMEVRLRLYNEGWLPVTWFEANHQLGLGAVDTLAGAMPPLGSLVVAIPLQASRRGFFPAGVLDITLGDPLGIFVGRRRLQSDQHLTVYPRALRLARLPLALRQPYGHVRTRKRAQEDLTSLADVRPWRSGDSPRHIHWKVSAHRGELQVREYELAATAEVNLVLDLCRTAHQGEGPEGSDERAIEIAASLARTILEQGLPVGLLAHGSRRFYLTPGNGLRQLKRVLETLVEAEADGLLPVAEVLAEQRQTFTARSTIVIVSPAIDRELISQVAALKWAGHGLMVVAVRTVGPAGETWEKALAALREQAVPTVVAHEAGDLVPTALASTGVRA